MGVNTEILLEQAREAEVKAVVEAMKTIDPEPGEEPDSDLVFDACKNALVNQGLVNLQEESQTIQITEKGQLLLSLMMARLESASDFVMSLNMSAEETTKTLEDLVSLTRVGTAIKRIMNHMGGGQPGFLLQFFSFSIYRAILITNSMFVGAEKGLNGELSDHPSQGELADFFDDDDGDGTVH